MVDIELLVQALRQRGHSVGNVTPVPAGAGDYTLTVDGAILDLAEARGLLERDQDEHPKEPRQA